MINKSYKICRSWIGNYCNFFFTDCLEFREQTNHQIIGRLYAEVLKVLGSGCNHESYVISKKYELTMFVKETSAEIARQPCGVYLFTEVMSRADDDARTPPPPHQHNRLTTQTQEPVACWRSRRLSIVWAARLGSHLFFSSLEGSRVLYELQVSRFPPKRRGSRTTASSVRCEPF